MKSLIPDMKIDSEAADFNSDDNCVQYLKPRLPISPSVNDSLLCSVTSGTVLLLRSSLTIGRALNMFDIAFELKPLTAL